jgi:hypothetical protein
MDFFDERVLAALKDGKPRGFTRARLAIVSSNARASTA